jgi:tetratricopeptide (TPR) repeat protein
MHSTSLTDIVALARAGAIDRALREYEAGGFGSAPDPAAQTVRARLLKDLAKQRAGDERRRLYREAAEAYRWAFEMRPGSYPLINAATLSLLAGDVERSRTLAGEVLVRIEEEPNEPETPYWRSATAAEALLLLGRKSEAGAALAEAVAVAPRAWEDHASTLRQFALILAAQGGDPSWLDTYRPPRSLHFGGHMSFDSRVVRRDLDQTIAAILEEERIGFGYGALAAGADILIAEALVARGAELHVVLPGSLEAFASHSVGPFGGTWRRRFDALIEKAETVHTGRPGGVLPGPQTIAVADEVAMGAAAMNALRLESEAVQLLVIDGGGLTNGRASARARAIWAGSERRQRLLKAPREAIDALEVPGSTNETRVRSMAIIAIFTAQTGEDEALEGELRALRQAIAESPDPLVAPYWTGERVLLAHERLELAAELTQALAQKGYRVGADYVAAANLVDAFSGSVRLGPSASGAAEAAASSTPIGSACVTAEFAAALAARGRSNIRAELVGELESRDGGAPIALYALKR